jgi:hypothetical protein
LLIDFLELGVQLSEGFGECGKSFGEELGGRVLGVLAASRNLLPAVEAQGAALLMSETVSVSTNSGATLIWDL